jgi:hypothetical protein
MPVPGGPEMLPSRLAAACVAVLPVAGAGISVFSNEFRVPVGASAAPAAAAERLQFTTGEGPCLSVHASGVPAAYTESDLAARWPDFHEELVEATPYRAVVSVPLPKALTGVGALDLYFTEPDGPARLPIDDASAVGALVADLLGRQPWVPALTGLSEPNWLHASPAVQRGMVSVAMGMVSVAVGLTLPDALAALRAHAYAAGQTLDELAGQVVNRSVPIEELRLNSNQ